MSPTTKLENATEIFMAIANALRPQFTPHHPDWLPQCAHPKDAAADLKVWAPETKDYKTLVSIYNRLMLQYSQSKIFIDGQEVTSIEEQSHNLLNGEGYSYVLLTPGEQKLINVGFKIALPTLLDPFTAAYRVSPRSGLANKFGITIVNSPGLIDCYYRNDVGIILKNGGEGCHFFSHGARIAQGAYEILVAQSTWSQEEKLSVELNETVRKGGFGHTGI